MESAGARPERYCGDGRRTAILPGLTRTGALERCALGGRVLSGFAAPRDAGKDRACRRRSRAIGEDNVRHCRLRLRAAWTRVAARPCATWRCDLCERRTW